MRAKKSFGQHFLTNNHVSVEMCDEAQVNLGDTVIEIGPGTGILTKELLGRAGRVIAIEKDPDLIPILKEKFTTEIKKGCFVLFSGDILEKDTQDEVFSSIAGNYKIVANIPYYITGKLIRLFLTFPKQPQNITLLVQKEVAERVVARNHKESLLSLGVKAYGVPKYIKTVKAGNFNPPPKVDSAILFITDISRDFFSGFSEESFFTLLRAGFAHKRKRLRGNIKDTVEEKGYSLDHLSENVRAEDLALADWSLILEN